MKLYLLRHGIAKDPSPKLADAERPLTERGRRRVQQIALALEQLRVKPTTIVTSPLLRARQTAAIVAQTLGLQSRLHEDALLAPVTTASRLRDWIGEQLYADELLLVGHEPLLSELALLLCGAANGRLVLKKGGLCRIDLTGLDDAQLLWLLPPKALAALGS